MTYSETVWCTGKKSGQRTLNISSKKLILPLDTIPNLYCTHNLYIPILVGIIEGLDLTSFSIRKKRENGNLFDNTHIQKSCGIRTVIRRKIKGDLMVGSNPKILFCSVCKTNFPYFVYVGCGAVIIVCKNIRSVKNGSSITEIQLMQEYVVAKNWMNGKVAKQATSKCRW